MIRNRGGNKKISTVGMAFYGTAKIYTSNQIKLDPNLLATLGIKVGDRVNIYLDTEDSIIVITSADKQD